MVLISLLQPGMEEAQLRAPGEAIQCLCSLWTEGVLLGLRAFVLESTPGLIWVPSPSGRHGSVVVCVEQTSLQPLLDGCSGPSVW